MAASGDRRSGTAGRAGRRRRLSRLTLRIVAINVLAVGILFAGVLYLERYQDRLIAAELKALSRQAGIFARAMAELTVEREMAAEGRLSARTVRGLLRRVDAVLGTRARIFGPDGQLIADSLVLGQRTGLVRIHPLPPPDSDPVSRFTIEMYERLANWLPRRGDMPVYRERPAQRAEHYREVQAALLGEARRLVRATDTGGLILSVAVPVQRYKRVLGALMLSIEGAEIDRAVRAVRFEILAVFAVVFTVTVALSLYLAGSITRPIQRLAAAADHVGAGHGRHGRIPDFGDRGDEIGDLARAMREMTEALSQRIDAIERFAADVAHEIKNPLTSVRSAVETAARISDPDQRARLLAIILDDVQRLDRLITDIADASRLEAELSRAEPGRIDLRALLETLSDVYTSTRRPGTPALVCRIRDGEDHHTLGHELRLVQVIRNLISNAASFSPADQPITLSARREGGEIVVTVEDCGPGIPPGKLEAIFERFYTERPEGEKFGTHSGLGLSISRQIVEAHGGRIRAENVTDSAGRTIGARFILRLPAAPPDRHQSDRRQGER